MASSNPQPEIPKEFLPVIRLNKDGHIERLFDTETLPPGTDQLTGVSSKDITIIPHTEVYVRLYLPASVNHHHKLPVVVYFHGGGFFLSTANTNHYHNYLNKLVSISRVILVSVNYRLAPENPIPAAYEDSWEAVKWVYSQRVASGSGSESWLLEHADFGRLFLDGFSAGGNIAHYLAMRAGNEDLGGEIYGVAMVHPYFWGSDCIGSEDLDPVRRLGFDKVWPFVCPSSPDNDDPRINPVAKGAPSLAGLRCRRVLVSAAGKDMFRDRGWLYYKELGRSGWAGVIEIHEIDEVDHGFHIYNSLNNEKVNDLINRLSTFYNDKK